MKKHRQNTRKVARHKRLNHQSRSRGRRQQPERRLRHLLHARIYNVRCIFVGWHARRASALAISLALLLEVPGQASEVCARRGRGRDRSLVGFVGLEGLIGDVGVGVGHSCDVGRGQVHSWRHHRGEKRGVEEGASRGPASRMSASASRISESETASSCVPSSSSLVRTAGLRRPDFAGICQEQA